MRSRARDKQTHSSRRLQLQFIQSSLSLAVSDDRSGAEAENAGAMTTVGKRRERALRPAAQLRFGSGLRATRTILLSALAVAISLTVAAENAAAQSQVVGWGKQVFNSAWNVEQVVQVAAGDSHSAARRADGMVVAWGNNDLGQCNVPALPPGLTFVAVAVGFQHAAALRSDGSIVAWGDNTYGQCNVSTRFRRD